MIQPTSRYYPVQTATYTAPDGTSVVYLKRRIIPDASTMATLAEHQVTEGERLDAITARYLTDPEQFWRLCDSNNAMHPDELTSEIGRRLRIAFPQ